LSKVSDLADNLIENAAEQFTDDVMGVIETLIEAGVANEVVAPLTLKLVDIIGRAFDAGAHAGVDIFNEAASSLVDVVLGGPAPE
jgi:N-acetylglucosamine kinase-like BadF-type ATPase